MKKTKKYEGHSLEGLNTFKWMNLWMIVLIC